MGDLVVTILIVVGVLAVTTVLFGGWLIVSFFRGAWRLIDRGSNRSAAETSSGRGCGNPGCRIVNPMHARFCRRCGADLGHISGPLAGNIGRAPQRSDQPSNVASSV